MLKSAAIRTLHEKRTIAILANVLLNDWMFYATFVIFYFAAIVHKHVHALLAVIHVIFANGTFIHFVRTHYVMYPPASIAIR